jgi:hypothetical protein
MAVLFIATLVVALPATFGAAGARARESHVAEDRERQPLLDDQ